MNTPALEVLAARKQAVFDPHSAVMAGQSAAAALSHVMNWRRARGGQLLHDIVGAPNAIGEGLADAGIAAERGISKGLVAAPAVIGKGIAAAGGAAGRGLSTLAKGVGRVGMAAGSAVVPAVKGVGKSFQAWSHKPSEASVLADQFNARSVPKQ